MSMNVWQPVALSRSIEAGTSAGTHLAGEEIVVWRDTAGAAHVWEDRCPHRGMKLSFGFVRGDHIACLYHGWQYGSDGQCRYIPAHPDLDVPRTIKVPVYAVTEHAGMIWTALGDDAPPFDAPVETVPVRTLSLDCAASVAVGVLERTALVPASGQVAAQTVVQQRQANLWSVSAAADTLLVGVQSLGDDCSALHIVIAGSADVYGAAAQAHFDAWALRLRHAVEHPEKPLFARRAEPFHEVA